MQDITGLNVRQLRLYRVDVIPFRFLSTKAGSDYIKTQFQFKDSGVEGGELFFVGGCYVADDAGEVVIPINILTVNERRIAIDVIGPTQDNEVVFKEVIAKIAAMDGERRLSSSEPLIVTNETRCIVTMDFTWQELLAEPLFHFLSGPALRAMESESATARVASMGLKFTIAFSSSDSSLAEHGITLSDKTFTIEPRVDTPLGERRFFTYSPLDSTAHLRLFGELEQAMKSRSGKSRKGLPAAR